MTHPPRVFRFLAFAAAGLLVAGAGAAAIGIAAGTKASAGTGSGVSLPSLSRLHQVLVDTSADKGAGYIFYSEGLPAGILEKRESLAKSGIIVTTLNGSYVTTLESADGTEGVALSADGSTLYAAIAGGIAAISTDTLATEDDVPLVANGGTLLPYDLAVQGGDLWISYLAENAAGDTVGNGIGGLSLADIASNGAATLTPAQLSGPAWSIPPSLAADPENHGVLVAVEEGQSPPQVATYNVESATPDTPVATSAAAAVQFVNCASGAPATVLPGGGSFLMSCDGTETSYSAATLERGGTYGAGLPFSADDGVDVAAVAPDGTIALGTSVTVTGTGDIPLAQAGTYDPSGTSLLNTYGFGTPDTQNSVAGLSWDPAGSTLYAVVAETSSAATSSYALDVLSGADRATPALALGGTSKAAYGTPVSISGQLTFSAYSGPWATALAVTRTHAGGSTASLGKVTATADGTFSFKDTASLPPGTWIYTISYAGTAITAPAKATRTVVISKAACGAKLTASAADVKAGTTVHLTVKVPKTAGPARTIDIYAAPAGESKKLVKSAEVGPGGKLEIAYKMARSTRFSAVVTGNSDFNGGTLGTTIRVSAK